jgi:hypothetical protein
MAGKYHYTVSANYCNVEADDIATLNEKMREMVNDIEFPVLLEQFTAVTKVGSVPTPQQAVANVQAAMPAQVVSQEPANAPKPPPSPMQETAGSPEGEMETDRWGKKYYYNRPDAPLTPDGRKAVLKDWTSQAGKHLKRWVDPLDGPRSHAHNGPKWEGDWAN